MRRAARAGLLRGGVLPGLLLAAILILPSCTQGPPPPAEIPDLKEGDSAGFAAYRLENRSGSLLSVVLEDTATRQVLTVDLDAPKQEIHVARILKARTLEMPDETALRPRLTVLRLRPGDYRVKRLGLERGRRRGAEEGSGEIFTVEAGLLTYLGEFRAKSKVPGVKWGVSVETVDLATEQLEGIAGRIGVRKQIVRLR